MEVIAPYATSQTNAKALLFDLNQDMEANTRKDQQ
jgi:hypothetical protein